MSSFYLHIFLFSILYPVSKKHTTRVRFFVADMIKQVSVFVNENYLLQSQHSY